MEKEKKKGIQRFLDFVERGGNKLPHPLTLFWIFCVIIAIISAIAANSGASVTYEAFDRKEKVSLINLEYKGASKTYKNKIINYN